MIEKNIKPFKPEVTDERRIEIAYTIPYTLGKDTAYTVIKQKDFLKIIRSIRCTELKEHLTKFIEFVDGFSMYKTDVLNQKLDRKKNKEYREIELIK